MKNASVPDRQGGDNTESLHLEAMESRVKWGRMDLCTIQVPGKRASKEAKTAARDRAQARLNAMVAKVRGHEPIEELFARLVIALDRLTGCERSRQILLDTESTETDHGTQAEARGL